MSNRADIDNLRIVIEGEDQGAKSKLDSLVSSLEKVNSQLDKLSKHKGFSEIFGAAQKVGKNIERIGTAADKASKAVRGIGTASKSSGKDIDSLLNRVTKSAERVMSNVEKVEAKASRAAKSATNALNESTTATSRSGSASNTQAEDFNRLRDSAEASISPIRHVASCLAEIPGALARFSVWSFDRLTNAAISTTQRVWGLTKALGSVAIAVAKIQTFPFSFIGNALSGIGAKINKIGSNLLRMAKLRFFRGIIKTVVAGFREGIANAYQWANVMGNQFAGSMDNLASSAQYLKNSLAAMAMPLYNALVPVFEAIVDKVVAVLNVINQLIARFTGASTWTRAVKVPKAYAEGMNSAASGAEKLRKELITILGIDELNLMEGDNPTGSGGGGGGAEATDYGSMFEEVALGEMSDEMAAFFDPFVKAWENKGKGVLDAIDNALTNISKLTASVKKSFWTVWTNGTGQRSIEHILGVFTGIFDTIGNIADRLNVAWNTDNLGTAIVQDLWDMLNDILGMFDRISNATAKWAKSLDFTPLLRAFEKVTKAVEPVVKNITDGLYWAYENVLLPFAKWTIEAALPAGLEAVASAFRLLNDILETLKPYAQWVWENFLSPLASWAGGAVVGLIEGVAGAFEWVSNALEPITTLAGGVIAFLTGDFEKAMKMFDEAWDKLTGKNNTTINGTVETTVADAVGQAISVTASVVKLEDNIPLKEKQIDNMMANVETKADKIPLKEKQIDGMSANFEKRTVADDVKKAVDLTANYKKRTIADEVKKAIDLTSNFNKRTIADSVKKAIDLTANYNKRTVANAVKAAIDLVANFNKRTVQPSVTASVNIPANLVSKATAVPKAKGGILERGHWRDIPQYADGTLNAASLFYAGENGPELVGHVNGRTEVLNQSQLAATMASSMTMATAGQNRLLQEQNDLIRTLIEAQKDIRAYVTTGDLVDGFQRMNRRDGRTVVPIGV